MTTPTPEKTTSTSNIDSAESSSTQTMEELLSACIHCGFCLPTCPTYQVTGSEAESPRGRIYLMQSLLKTPEEFNGPHLSQQDITPHIESCLGCLACQTTCPSGVQYSDLLHHSKQKLQSAPSQNSIKRQFKRWAFQHLLPHPQRLKWLTQLTKFYQSTGIQFLARHFSPLWHFFPQLKAPVDLLPNIGQWQSGRPSIKEGQQFGNPAHPKVALFTGCIMNQWFQRIHWATIRVLMGQGYCVQIPPQTCCGALAEHSGESDIAAPLATTNIKNLLAADTKYIVINSAGCGSTLKEYPKHIDMTDEEKQQWDSKVIDILELLQKEPLSTKQFIAPFKETQYVAYQAACHLRHAQGISQIEANLLSQLPDVQCIPLHNSETCCGSAGTYNMEHPDMGKALLKNKMDAISQALSTTSSSKLQWLVSANPGCLMQFEYGLRKHPITKLPEQPKLAHPIELIAQYYPKVTR